MSHEERTPLLSSSNSTNSDAVVKKTVNVIKKIANYYAKAIRLIHAREFMAEFLATFILVVRHVFLIILVYHSFSHTYCYVVKWNSWLVRACVYTSVE